jgi:hypothetical protein
VHHLRITHGALGAAQRKRMHRMLDFVALDLVRQQRMDIERRAEHARLVREARPRRQRGRLQDG